MSGDEDEHDVLLRAAQGEDKFSTRVSCIDARSRASVVASLPRLAPHLLST